jgi:hypothetical protein
MKNTVGLVTPYQEKTYAVIVVHGPDDQRVSRQKEYESCQVERKGKFWHHQGLEGMDNIL